MSPITMKYIYYATIALIGILMITNPQSLIMGKQKFTEEGVKTQGLIKKLGIIVVLSQVVLIIYTIIKHNA